MVDTHYLIIGGVILLVIVLIVLSSKSEQEEFYYADKQIEFATPNGGIVFGNPGKYDFRKEIPAEMCNGYLDKYRSINPSKIPKDAKIWLDSAKCNQSGWWRFKYNDCPGKGAVCKFKYQ